MKASLSRALAAALVVDAAYVSGQAKSYAAYKVRCSFQSPVHFDS